MLRALKPWELEFVCAKMQYQPTDGCRSVAIIDGKEILAACMYDHWAHSSVNVHVYSTSAKGLLNPDFVREIFNYPFVTCDRAVLLCLSPANAPSVVVAKALGFRLAYAIKDGWNIGEDLYLLEHRREDCRYLNLKKVA